ncbi:hypothetical protein RCL1_002832 [Eukaryota sp. TZLM3-RCL]
MASFGDSPVHLQIDIIVFHFLLYLSQRILFKFYVLIVRFHFPIRFVFTLSRSQWMTFDEVINGRKVTITPKFSASQAHDYYSKIYSDPLYIFKYEAPQWLNGAPTQEVRLPSGEISLYYFVYFEKEIKSIFPWFRSASLLDLEKMCGQQLRNNMDTGNNYSCTML